ncbi:MAG: sodium:solute symporter family protein, partial [Candidatus Bipolaricaulis sp.]|nr:sodium:solute symporter family protein [Candidatus Bipolaricaulis sp.]
MAVRIAVVASYLGILLAIGLLARARRRRSPDDYFLASRTLPGWVLFLTMAATNFSAFTVFGFSGAGWRIGYAFYPIMAFGTGFMALAFVLIGHPVWRLGKAHGLVTPPELVYERTKSPGLRLVFFLVMAAFTLPYLAIQPMAAGYALQSLFGIPYYAGAAVVTGVILLYVLVGGFRGEVWTDVFQGAMMIVLMAVGLAAVAAPFGGIAAANRTAAAELPALFSRPGLDGSFTPGIWFGYMILWFLCDPMFPQLFQRFYAAKSPRGLSTSMALYPLVTGLLFLFPVAVGVIGRLSYPELPAGAASDGILPLLLHKHASPLVETLVLSAGLAALITTLDSQLLTLSSMFTRDIYAPVRAWLRTRQDDRQASPPSEWVGRAFVVLLGLAGLALAYRPPATFLEITTEAFTGLAVLFP